MANYNEIEAARRLLGLGETASLKEIKTAYRNMAKRHHPDKHPSVVTEDIEMMKKLNTAYKLIMDYCNEYRYSFRQEDIASVYPEEEDHRKWRENWSDSI